MGQARFEMKHQAPPSAVESTTSCGVQTCAGSPTGLNLRQCRVSVEASSGFTVSFKVMVSARRRRRGGVCLVRLLRLGQAPQGSRPDRLAPDGVSHDVRGQIIVRLFAAVSRRHVNVKLVGVDVGGGVIIEILGEGVRLARRRRRVGPGRNAGSTPLRYIFNTVRTVLRRDETSRLP